MSDRKFHVVLPTKFFVHFGRYTLGEFCQIRYWSGFQDRVKYTYGVSIILWICYFLLCIETLKLFHQAKCLSKRNYINRKTAYMFLVNITVYVVMCHYVYSRPMCFKIYNIFRKPHVCIKNNILDFFTFLHVGPTYVLEPMLLRFFSNWCQFICKFKKRALAWRNIQSILA